MKKEKKNQDIYIFIFFWCGTKVTAGGHVMIGHHTKKRRKKIFEWVERGVFT